MRTWVVLAALVVGAVVAAIVIRERRHRRVRPPRVAARLLREYMGYRRKYLFVHCCRLHDDYYDYDCRWASPYNDVPSNDLGSTETKWSTVRLNTADSETAIKPRMA
jgi:hypothetical protein